MDENNDTLMMSRDKIIIRTSIIGILINVLLAGSKALIGVLVNSIAIVLDAVNNLSDAMSSIITIIGTKVANRLPDKKHPLGLGRAEYIAALLVAAIVLYAGITSAYESVKKIIHPEAADYNTASLIIMAMAIVVKLFLGRYFKSQGKKVNSASLIASGSDATFDAILTASVLASAIIYLVSGLSLEAYVGLLISFFIIRSGIGMVTETLDEILGVRADPELTGRIKAILSELPGVRGAYDLVPFNYGPDKIYASVHLELPDTMKVSEVDILTRKAQALVYKETGVILTGVGVYSYNTQNDEAAMIRDDVRRIVMSHDWALQFHGFYIELAEKVMRFDVVMSFDIDYRQGLQILCEEIQKAYPDYNISIAPDVDITD